MLRAQEETDVSGMPPNADIHTHHTDMNRLVIFLFNLIISWAMVVIV
jgi:hypothetical protein